MMDQHNLKGMSWHGWVQCFITIFGDCMMSSNDIACKRSVVQCCGNRSLLNRILSTNNIMSLVTRLSQICGES